MDGLSGQSKVKYIFVNTGSLRGNFVTPWLTPPIVCMFNMNVNNECQSWILITNNITRYFLHYLDNLVSINANYWKMKSGIAHLLARLITKYCVADSPILELFVSQSRRSISIHIILKRYWANKGKKEKERQKA